jgi:histone H3/H4
LSTSWPVSLLISITIKANVYKVANLAVIHAERVTIQVKDIKLDMKNHMVGYSMPGGHNH